MVAPGNITVVGVKLGSVIANLASIASFSLYIAERTSTLPTRAGVIGLNVVLHLAILTAIAFGVLWTVAELVFGWSYGAGGGDRLASGWSAVVLSLSMTVPLAFVPFLYQRLTGVHLLLPMHWRAIVLVMALAIGCHLWIYGTSKHKPNGLRERIVPAGEENTRFSQGLTLEATYTVLFVGVSVMAYRLVVNPSEPFLEIVIGRTLLSCLVFFSGMALFIAFKYPGSLRDSSWIQVRGIVSGPLIMFSLCGGMFS